YTMVEADENNFVRVQETFTDDTGQSTTLPSTATASKVVDAAPAPAAPTVSGNAVEGSTLTASSVTTGSDEELGIAYQWQRSSDGSTWSNISGAPAGSYTLGEADENNFVRVQETFTDDPGQSTTLPSTATASKVVDAAPTPAAPTVSGNAVEGSTLTASSVTTGSDEALGIAYQWQRSSDGSTWSNISGATAGSYTLGEADENNFVRVQETFTDDTGQSTTLPSTATTSKG